MSHTPPATPATPQFTNCSPQLPSTTTPDVTAVIAERLSTELSKLCVALATISASQLEHSNPLPIFDAIHTQLGSHNRECLKTSGNQHSFLSEVDCAIAGGPLTTESGGPFIRLVTHGHGTLVHLGQLVGILDDRSAFLLQRVVSFDPTRVQLHMLANLKPADILLLTESKLQQRRQRRERELRVRDGNLLSSLITTVHGLESKQRAERANVSAVEDCNNNNSCLTIRHGPVHTTPGLVLIRADQVRELGIIPEHGASSAPWMPDLLDLDLSASGEMPSQSADERNSVITGQPAVQQDNGICHEEIHSAISGLNDINATSTAVKRTLQKNINCSDPVDLDCNSHPPTMRSTGSQSVARRDRQRGAQGRRARLRIGCGACGVGPRREDRANKVWEINPVASLVPSGVEAWTAGNRPRKADNKRWERVSLQPHLVAYDSGIASMRSADRISAIPIHQTCCCVHAKGYQAVQWRRTFSKPRGRNRRRFSTRKRHVQT